MSLLQNGANKTQLQELLSYIAHNINVPTIGIGGGYAPIGTIISYMGTTAPQDYLACDGSTKNIADYPQLADFFEAQFGSKNYFGGDGVTTFAVPDLQGEFLRGTGTNSHTNQGSGDNVGVHQDGTEIPLIHNWETAILLEVESSSRDTSFPNNLDSEVSNQGARKYLNATASILSGSDATPRKGMTRPTNTSVLYCIKAVVAGDVYSTDERVVGTWIDGKPLYQKTISFYNTTLSQNQSNIGDISDIPIDFGWVDNIVGNDGDGYFENTGYIIAWIRKPNDNIGVQLSMPYTITYSELYITLQYTKTTD